MSHDDWQDRPHICGLQVIGGNYLTTSLSTSRVMTTTPSRRGRIRELLQLLASEEEQLAYERNVPHVDITAELVCMWFDDLYDTKHAATDSTFSGDEQAALAEFHRFYNARVDRLPESRGTVRTWLASAVWREIMEQARRTVERIVA
jgi:hypothetical protein